MTTSVVAASRRRGLRLVVVVQAAGRLHPRHRQLVLGRGPASAAPTLTLTTEQHVAQPTQNVEAIRRRR